MLVLLGPSKSGKTTIAKKLAEEYGMEQQITYTTRAPRPGEIDGVHYHFISKDKFREMYETGLFCEYDIYRDEFYGSSLEGVEDTTRLVAVLTPRGLQGYLSKVEDIFAVRIDSKAEIRARIMLSSSTAEWGKVVKQIASDDLLYNQSDTGANAVVTNTYSGKMELVDKVFNLYVKYLNSKNV